MNEMIKRRKDGGFTLIELMIVIAVIGILAVVLVPKMGSMRDSAKSAGVITNAKSVEAYAVANINKWMTKGNTPAEVIGFIQGQFNTGDNDLTNPYGDSIAIGTSSDKGKVTVEAVTADKLSAGLKIKGYGNGTSDADIVYENIIKP